MNYDGSGSKLTLIFYNCTLKTNQANNGNGGCVSTTGTI